MPGRTGKGSGDCASRILADKRVGAELNCIVGKCGSAQSVWYSAIQDIVLSNGEKIPVLREYLEVARRVENIKLILELKIGKKSDPAWSREAARRSVDLVREKKLQLRTEYITFDLEAAKELIRLAPESDVYYLNGDLPPQELKSLGFAGLDYHFDVMRKNPQWFSEAKRLGLGINVWTVNDMDMMREMIDAGADFITTDFPVEALKVISLDLR